MSDWKNYIRRWFWPLMRGWPDEGRRIVQGPHLTSLLDRAVADSGKFRRIYNAGAGEGGYSGLLLSLPGVESLVESDFGWRSFHPPVTNPKQLFFCASLTEVPIADHTFDLVLCTEVLEHIQEHEQALDEIVRVAAPSGWLLITVPTPPAIDDPAHVREGYKAAELGGMLEQRGFEVVDKRFCMHFWFRLVLKNWSRLPWCPRILIRIFAWLDRILPIGPPMDLMILARLVGAKTRPSSAGAGRTGPLEGVQA
jgi:SAM-dependent methyltransferase